MQTTGDIALVTGGGSGIGLALASAPAARNNTVVIGGRDQRKRNRARDQVPGLHTTHLDVTTVAAAPERWRWSKPDHDCPLDTAVVL